MATRIDIKKMKHPKIELLDKKAQTEKEEKENIEKQRKNLSRALAWILVILIVMLVLESLFLVMR